MPGESAICTLAIVTAVVLVWSSGWEAIQLKNNNYWRMTSFELDQLWADYCVAIWLVGKQNERGVTTCSYWCYDGNLIVIDHTDLIIRQPQIMFCQEELSADPFKKWQNKLLSTVAASTDNQLYSKSIPALYVNPARGVGHQLCLLNVSNGLTLLLMLCFGLVCFSLKKKKKATIGLQQVVSMPMKNI